MDPSHGFDRTRSDVGNWFIAFVVPHHWFHAIERPPVGCALLDGEDLHSTVAFFGRSGEARAHRAFDALEERLGREPFDPPMVSLGRVVPMGSPRSWSALSALLDEGRQVVESFLLKHRDALADAAGAARDLRPPRAHVTLARLSRRASAVERQAASAWARGLVLEARFRLGRIALYTSASESGRRYRRVRERSLA